MKQLTILVDMDDTIEDLLHAWLGYLNNRYGLHVTDEDVRDWNLTVAYPSLTAEQVYGALYEDEMWRTVTPLPDAAEYMRKLLADGHEIYIVTSSNYTTLKTKMDEVLFRYFPFINWSHVIIATNKQMIRGDVLVDDAPHNLVGGEYFKIMMDAPHNRTLDETKHGVQRVRTWAEIYDKISSLANTEKGVAAMDKITFFSTDCPKCKILKKKLDEKGIPYEENHNIEEMIQLGMYAAPSLLIGEDLMDFTKAIAWVNNQ